MFKLTGASGVFWVHVFSPFRIVGPGNQAWAVGDCEAIKTQPASTWHPEGAHLPGRMPRPVMRRANQMLGRRVAGLLGGRS